MKRAAVLASLMFLAACGVPVEESTQESGITSTVADAGDADAGPMGVLDCEPGTSQSCDCTPEGMLYDDGGASGYACLSQQCDATGHWGDCMGGTPLVLVFDGAPVSFTDAASARFDIWGEGREVAVDWPTARTPWLALDVDGNGRIDDGRELFGSMTRLPDGRRAHNGFEALAALDSNHDGRITAADAAWPMLRLWADANGDRRSSAEELQPLASRGLVSIDLQYRVEPRCTARNDCEVERASFTWRGADGSLLSGEVVDVHLGRQSVPVAVR